MEPRGAIASYDEADDLLTVWVSAQDTPPPARAASPHVLGRPDESIHVIVPDVGGAFGSKGAPRRRRRWSPRRAMLRPAGQVGRGPRGELPRLLPGPRHGGRGRARARRRRRACSRVRARIRADLGGYLMPTRAIPPHTTAMLMCGVYDDPGARTWRSSARAPNKVPTGPYRGAGRPEAAYFLECTVDDRRARARHRPARAAPPQPVREFPYRTRARLDLRLGRLRALPRPRGGARRGRSARRRRRACVGTGFGMYVERAGGQFETARGGAAADGPAPRPQRLVAARPGPRHDVRADRRRRASASSSTTSSSASATRARCRAGSARSRAARWRWGARRSRRRSTR